MVISVSNMIKQIIFKVLPIFALVALTMVFFWKFFFKGLVPFPGDLLTGAYFPWLDYKWGYSVGVPVKNPLISDVYSQIYLWKDMVISSIRNGLWPLWNPSMFSGYPLMANFQSGLFNPLNLFPLIFGMINGWSLMIWGQVIGSAITMYLLLRNFKYSRAACILGSVVYALGGFPIVWMEYATVGQAMIWLPLLILAVDSGKFVWLPVLFFFVVGAGHFQALVYSAVVVILYFGYRYWRELKSKLPSFLLFAFLSTTLSCIQLLPTIELGTLGIRFTENYVGNFNFGLAPWKHLFTLIAPDFFGSPITNNYWGAFNYENVIYYSGIVALLALVTTLLNWRKLGKERFFVCLAFVSLLIGFDSVIGRSIYIFHLPGLSTSVAGRIGMVFTFSVAVLAAYYLNNLKEIEKKIIYGSVGVVILFFAFGIAYLLLNVGNSNNINVGLRNCVIPGALLGVISMALFFRKKEMVKWIFLTVTICELFRFGWKYTTYSPKTLIYPRTEVIDFVTKDLGVYRVEREQGEVLPPNTWAAYGIQSPSGYDPMAVKSYVEQYNRDLNMVATPGASRYTELENYNAELLGKYNVKYLLAIKRDKNGDIPGSLLSKKININDWNRVFESKTITVLQNNKYQERARIVDLFGNMAKGETAVESFGNNKLLVKFTNIDGDKLILADAYYPGWIATINGKQTKIGSEFKPFRTVDIREIKSGEIVFEYKPLSFRIGLYVSIISLAAWLFLLLLKRK